MSYIPGSKAHVMAVVDDLVSDLMYDGRKEDEELPRGRIEELVRSGELTVEEIEAEFSAELRRVVKP